MPVQPDRKLPPRRVRARRRLVLTGLAAAAAVTSFAIGAIAGQPGGGDGPEPRDATAAPTSPARLAAARAWVARRRGRVAFSVVQANGAASGWNTGAQFIAASVVKVMLLVADVDRLARARVPLDDERADVLSEMIRFSDNDAANAVYADVGDAGLRAVARRAGLRSFVIGPSEVASCRCSAERWARAQVSASDMARLMAHLHRTLPDPHAGFARSLLAGIVPSQRWGIPEIAEPRWRTYFKGGVRVTGLGVLVHQIARLEDGSGGSVGLAVLTDANPSRAYGIETVRGVARALLGPRAPAGSAG